MHTIPLDQISDQTLGQAFRAKLAELPPSATAKQFAGWVKGMAREIEVARRASHHVASCDDAQSAPRAFTPAEARERFLHTVHANVLYWAQLENKSAEERCVGLAFSLLVLLDGQNASFPAVKLVLNPHPADQAFQQSQGVNWFEPNMEFTAGQSLHVQFVAR